MKTKSRPWKFKITSLAFTLQVCISRSKIAAYDQWYHLILPCFGVHFKPAVLKVAMASTFPAAI
jgi:hypothetical protein